MQYRNDKYGNSLSALGYGCMRFTQRAGRIDVEKTEKELLAAIEAGVNYFDTAYIYPGSEAALGLILERNGLRDRVNIATKLPHYLLKKPDSIEKYFTTYGELVNIWSQTIHSGYDDFAVYLIMWDYAKEKAKIEYDAPLLAMNVRCIHN